MSWSYWRIVLWTMFHPRRAVARYEQCLDCLEEAAKPPAKSDFWAYTLICPTPEELMKYDINGGEA